MKRIKEYAAEINLIGEKIYFISRFKKKNQMHIVGKIVSLESFFHSIIWSYVLLVLNLCYM